MAAATINPRDCIEGPMMLADEGLFIEDFENIEKPQLQATTNKIQSNTKQ